MMRSTTVGMIGIAATLLPVMVSAIAAQVAPETPERFAVEATMARAERRALAARAGVMRVRRSLAAVAPRLTGLTHGGAVGAPLRADPPEAWLPQDPADSLYREGREALNRGDFQRAAVLFREIRRRFPRSDYTPDSYYWEAFALYRTGNSDRLRVALDVLAEQRQAHGDAATESQAEVLATRIRGRLAQSGDADAAREIAEAVRPLAPPPPPPSGAAAPAPAPRPGAPPQDAQDAENDMRIAALNALLQMDAERAVPILKQVLARRDAGSVELRRKAVFLVSQQRTGETEEILLDVVRNDPDAEVRAQAVFWLSEVPTESAAAALESILQGSNDHRVQEKAIFALSQHESDRAIQALRSYAERSDVSDELRGKAIFWLNEIESVENQAWLRALYGRLQSTELKEKVIFSVSQTENVENRRWLLDLARNGDEPIELRKKALFWAGESGVAIQELVRLYDSIANRAIKEQLIFVYSERRESEAVDKLMDIARNDPDMELRRKAIFWLGESNDPRVAQFLLEIINR